MTVFESIANQNGFKLGVSAVVTEDDRRVFDNCDPVEDYLFDYEIMPGDIILKDMHSDHSAQWGWIPTIGFAKSLLVICKSLIDGSSEELYEFTESDSLIVFRKHNNELNITTNYSDGCVVVTIEDFYLSITHILNDLFKFMSLKYSCVMETEYMLYLRKHVSTGR